MSLLEVRNLSHRFRNGLFGIRNVQFSLGGGEFLVIAGPNGSGKTVLMKHLNGLCTPSSGSVLFNGVDIRKNLNLVRQKIGLVFQDADSQIIGQTVAEDIEFGPLNLGLPEAETAERVQLVLEMTGLSRLADARSRQLSGGEKRLLAIAGVLAMEPGIIVLDEPFANLDFPAIRRIIGLIRELNAAGRTIILITHELEKILAHASRLIVMRSGEIVRDGSPREIFPSLQDFELVPPHLLRGRFEDMTW